LLSFFFGNVALLAEIITLPDGCTFEGGGLVASDEGLLISSESITNVPIEALSDEQIKQYRLDWLGAILGLRKKLGKANADLKSRTRALAARTLESPQLEISNVEISN